MDFSNFDQINRLLGVLEGNLWERWSCLGSIALRLGFSKILGHHMFKSDLWCGKSSTRKIKNNVRSKINFKFSNLLDMSKGRICVGNYMDIISMVLGYIDVNFQTFLLLIIAPIWPQMSCEWRFVFYWGRGWRRCSCKEHVTSFLVDCHSLVLPFPCTTCDFRYLRLFVVYNTFINKLSVRNVI